MSIWGKMVSDEKVIGGVITEFSCWGPLKVTGLDGLEYEIRIEIGHSGPEHNVYETKSSIAKRGVATRRRRKNA